MAEHASEVREPLAGRTPLVDVHAHFYQPASGRGDWQRVNASRLRAGERIGIRAHIASILGTWGHKSPTYFPSFSNVTSGNDAMLELQDAHPDRIRCYVTVNPNDTLHAREEIERCVGRGAVGIKLAASRRADDPLLDPIAEEASKRGLPVLHHIWQHRTREWPGQEISDGADLGALALRHPRASFILAHIGGGGDWAHSCAAVREISNIYVDLSGSGVDRGMLDMVYASVGASRMLWGCDITMETGLAKLRALEAVGLSENEIEEVRWRNAARIFPHNALPGIPTSGVAARRTDAQLRVSP
jgi:predicted TIM-barrel fold metal-dependent hydrolase